MLDRTRWRHAGQGTTQQATKSCRDQLIPHALLSEPSKSEGHFRRTLQGDSETCGDLVLEENRLNGNGGEVLKVD